MPLSSVLKKNISLKFSILTFPQILLNELDSLIFSNGELFIINCKILRKDWLNIKEKLSILQHMQITNRKWNHQEFYIHFHQNMNNQNKSNQKKNLQLKANQLLLMGFFQLKDSLQYKERKIWLIMDKVMLNQI